MFHMLNTLRQPEVSQGPRCAAHVDEGERENTPGLLMFQQAANSAWN